MILPISQTAERLISSRFLTSSTSVPSSLSSMVWANFVLIRNINMPFKSPESSRSTPSLISSGPPSMAGTSSNFMIFTLGRSISILWLIMLESAVTAFPVPILPISIKTSLALSLISEYLFISYLRRRWKCPVKGLDDLLRLKRLDNKVPGSAVHGFLHHGILADCGTHNHEGVLVGLFHLF